MDDARYKRYDIIFKWVGLIALLVSGWWGVHKYNSDRIEQARRDNDLRVKELNAFIFQRQAELYFDATRAAATIADGADKKQVQDATERFKQLYWGELVAVEDRRVELAMIAFFDCIKNNNCYRRRVNQYERSINVGMPDDSPFHKTDLALDLAACVRSALKKDRNIEFGEVRPANTSCPYD